VSRFNPPGQALASPNWLADIVLKFHVEVCHVVLRVSPGHRDESPTLLEAEGLQPLRVFHEAVVAGRPL
jgi:hypothetical protein